MLSVQFSTTSFKCLCAHIQFDYYYIGIYETFLGEDIGLLLLSQDGI